MARASLPMAVLLILAACAPRRTAEESELLTRMIVAQDTRPATATSIGPLLEGAAHANAEIRRFAVRALGRFERDTLIPMIAPLLEDASATVRAEAANALGQAVLDDDPDQARRVLRARLDVEEDAEVRGVIAETLGRLRHNSGDDVAATSRAIVAIDGDATAPGIAKGLYFLARQGSATRAYPEAAAARLRELAAHSMPSVRATSVAALVSSGAIEVADLEQALRDDDAFVRREAVLGLTPQRFDTTSLRPLVTASLEDPSPRVRYDALRAWIRVFRASPQGCEPIMNALHDEDTHVALLAIDNLFGGCDADAVLDSLAGTLPEDTASDAPWHRAAHALVTLAVRDTARALERLLPFVANGNTFVRTYAARAAARLGQLQTLRLFAADAHPNVRTEAVLGLVAATGHESDDIYVAQLESEDSQLLQTAAAALEGTSDTTALPALLDALDRITALRRETSRDARTALLERIEELGGEADTSRIRPYLRDFDPRIADQAADILDEWTGTQPETSPAEPPGLTRPTPAQLASLEDARFVFEMMEGGTFVVRLHAWATPTNSVRFARLAREGWFDGLSFHRIVANFIVQGGSPRANEYAGDGPYTRDELGLSNVRGSVGLSTRGRDTGDGQIYINLVDNVRLDHEYTVFAEVVDGMEVVDRLLEGARIRRVTLR